MSENVEPAGFVLDRVLQRAMLAEMRDAYPNSVRGFANQDGLSDAGLASLV